MDLSNFNELEDLLHQAATQIEYPPTPDIARLISGERIRRQRSVVIRRVAWGLALAILVVAGLMVVPPVRAAVLDFFRIGAVRIFLQSPSPTSPDDGDGVSNTIEPESGSLGNLTGLLSLADRPMSLAEAANLSGFPLMRMNFPNALGPPELVFYQDLGGSVVGLIWLDAENQDELPTSLLLADSQVFISKDAPATLERLQLDGYPAFWLSGEHFLMLRQPNGGIGMMIDGNVLIWEMEGITYRLESDLGKEDSIEIANEIIGGITR